MNKHNFGAGPCILPYTVTESAANAVRSLDDTGLSVLETNHRSPVFADILKETETLVRELMDVPDNYSVLFLQGGASMQFAMVPMAFLQGSGKTAAYLDTGYFSQKAIKEARVFGKVAIVGSSEMHNFNYIPGEYTVPEGAAYFHCTSNNTIEGTQMFRFPETNVPVICDMSSDIFSRVVDVSQFDLIYAGAQKNMGPAGMTMVIVKNALLDIINQVLPSMLDYRVYRDHGSLYNTPPVFAIYTAMLNLRWLKSMGGIEHIALKNLAKSQLLYAEIDQNPLFKGLAEKEHRSIMNVTFRTTDPETEAAFLKMADDKGIVGIRGYHNNGSFRASLYNALPYASVGVLVKCMAAFTAARKVRKAQEVS